MSNRRIRRSQLITQFGVGSIIEIGNESFIAKDLRFEPWSKAFKSPKYHLSPIPRLEKLLGVTIFDKDQSVKIETTKEIYGFPTSTTPYNVIYDVHRKFALFTKSVKSKSLYCAGYYIIHFNKGWVKSFCPKLITIERYESKGPFTNDLEMRSALSKVNAR